MRVRTLSDKKVRKIFRTNFPPMMEFWIRTRRRVQVKKFDETIASRPILVASVTFSVGVACTAVAFLVTGINVSNEGTRFVHVYLTNLLTVTSRRMGSARNGNRQQVRAVRDVRGIGYDFVSFTSLSFFPVCLSLCLSVSLSLFSLVFPFSLSLPLLFCEDEYSLYYYR